MASIENHPFDLLIHKEKCLQGYTLRLEAQFKESGKVHQSTTTPTNLRPWTVFLDLFSNLLMCKKGEKGGSGFKHD